MSGLTPGNEYILTQYTRGFGDPGGRLINIEVSDNGAVTMIDQNINGDQQGSIIKYSYTGPASGAITLSYSAVNPADTWHHYAFSNELATSVCLDPEPAPGEHISIYDQLSWTLNGAVDGPVYRLLIATDPGMSNLVTDVSGLTVTRYEPDLVPETEYYWQLEVSDAEDVVHISPVWSFTTLSVPPDAVKLLEWKFDETSGIIAAQTGQVNGADGIMTGFDSPSDSRVAGLANNGLYLNGKDEYVNVSSGYAYMPVADGESFAISGYICTFDDFGPLFSMRNSANENPVIDIALGADGVQVIPGYICLLVRDDSGSISWVNSGVRVNDGRWHNFIVSRKDSNWTLYVDGILRDIIDDAATGNLNLDMMAIGTSLRWIADNWQPQNNYYRDYQGILDEYTVWQGQLQPPQFDGLVSVLPSDEDVNFDLVIDLEDLSELAYDWIDNIRMPVQPEAILDDMEGYTSGQNNINDYWQFAAESGYGDIDVSVVNDPAGSYGHVMKMDYDFSNGSQYARVQNKLFNRGVNLGIYDKVNIRLRKLPGCEISKVILDFYDGRDKANPSIDELYYKGNIEIDIASAAVDQWVTVGSVIPEGSSVLRGCTDLYRIAFSIADGGRDIGSLLIDSIYLSDWSEDCTPRVNDAVADINFDCIVDMFDFEKLAGKWLNEN